AGGKGEAAGERRIWGALNRRTSRARQTPARPVRRPRELRRRMDEGEHARRDVSPVGRARQPLKRENGAEAFAPAPPLLLPAACYLLVAFAATAVAAEVRGPQAGHCDGSGSRAPLPFPQ